jgi:hypothetical protein
MQFGVSPFNLPVFRWVATDSGSLTGMLSPPSEVRFHPMCDGVPNRTAKQSHVEFTEQVVCGPLVALPPNDGSPPPETHCSLVKRLFWVQGCSLERDTCLT